VNKGLKHKILALRVKGFSYSKISKELNCSKSTISFHCNERGKEKIRFRQNTRRKNKPLAKKIENFLSRKSTKNKKNRIVKGYSLSFIIERLKIKTWHFVKEKKSRGYKKRMFNENELLEKIGTSPKCYLTGRPINLKESTSYALDHVVPKSSGGDNSLENCEIACIEANQAKHKMSYEEFVELCREVVNHYDSKKK
jgi:CRISPR/Cas system Type II protein with McrA/HNH and RuvC-like nuclease domain